MTANGNAAPLVDPEVVSQIKGWRGYVEAKLGFRNHWYLALFGNELRECEPVALKLLGENLLLNRVDGKVLCLKDRCLHRGVPLSRKLECYAKGTISCWYHGWTYRWEDGVLCDILTDPNSQMIGTRQLKSYPVQEAKGLIFVFVGDIEPPPLYEDLPPGFLDEDRYCLGIRRQVGSNWRLGAENGFDTTHVFIHKDSEFITARDSNIPLGFATAKKLELEFREADSEPKGVMDPLVGNYEPVYEATIEGQPAISSKRPKGALNTIFRISMWLPGTLTVENHPAADIIQSEFYVPVDTDQHMYFQILSKLGVAEQGQRDRFDEEFRVLHEPVALRGFNDDDVWAREATQEFYNDDRGWLEEQLFEADHNLVAWRKLASQHNRGIQALANTR